MEESREDRMRQRMRGAARHQVQEADFGDLFAFAIPAPEPEPEPESTESSDPPTEPSPDQTPALVPVKRTDPNTSAKRRRLNSEGPSGLVPSPAQPLSNQSSYANRSSRRAPRASIHRDPYELENAPSTVDDGGEVDEEGSFKEQDEATATPASGASTKRAAESSTSVSSRLVPRNQAPSNPSPSKSVQVDEVTESPADDPGSGHRRRLRVSNAVTSSALLQSALQSAGNNTGEGYLQDSSPLSRKSRKSTSGVVASARSNKTGLRRSTRLSGSPDDEVNETSFESPGGVEGPSGADVHSESLGLDGDEPEAAETLAVESTVVPEEDPEEAEEINDRDAALRLGRKRPRKPEVVASPELSPGSPEPVAKRQRKALLPKKKNMQSPAKQRQPKAPRAKPKKPTAAAARKGKDGDAGGAVPIKIQRFTKPRPSDDDGSGDEDPLNSAIPYASRRDVNAVDVLAGMCEQSIDKSLSKIVEATRSTQDAAGKKELRVKFKALEMFRDEIRTQLLGHAIALDDLYALKRRVRDAQRAKLKLRERIIEIRAEREQVQLRMDAVRVKHDQDSKEAMHNINLSAAMHDIDLAVEQGHAAPDLSAKEQKMAELANLELLISQVTEQACSSGPGGGALKQIKSFNAFLERAAAAL